MYITIYQKNSMIKQQKKGFTLIELLVVIGILAILLSITLIAINPARQFGAANNTKRKSAVTQLLNAVGAYAADQKGQLPPSILTGVPQPGAGTPPTMVEVAETTLPTLCTELVPNYIPALPKDPSLSGEDIDSNCATGWDTGYEIGRDFNDRITVSAPDAVNSETISVTR
jgi:type IV pilus assembly protein PilA